MIQQRLFTKFCNLSVITDKRGLRNYKKKKKHFCFKETTLNFHRWKWFQFANKPKWDFSCTVKFSSKSLKLLCHILSLKLYKEYLSAMIKKNIISHWQGGLGNFQYQEGSLRLVIVLIWNEGYFNFLFRLKRHKRFFILILHIVCWKLLEVHENKFHQLISKLETEGKCLPNENFFLFFFLSFSTKKKKKSRNNLKLEMRTFEEFKLNQNN